MRGLSGFGRLIRMAAVRVLRRRQAIVWGRRHRDRRNAAGNFPRRVEFYITDQSALAFRRRHAVDTNINDRGTGPDPLALDHLGPAHGRDENSAVRESSGRFLVLECANVTVNSVAAVIGRWACQQGSNGRR